MKRKLNYVARASEKKYRMSLSSALLSNGDFCKEAA